jgi:hypothetical protein
VPILQAVGLSTTTTTLQSDNAAHAFGEPVVLTANIASTGINPGGTVTFKNGTAVLGTALVFGGQATLTVSNLPVGTRSLKASYSGDAVFIASTSVVLAQTIVKAGTETALVSSTNVVVAGDSVTFTAAVGAAIGNGLPTGTITFKDGTKTLGTVPLVGGRASLTTSALPVGNRSITAAYSGSASFIGSKSSTVVVSVTKSQTTAAIATSASAATVGSPITLTATIRSVAGNSMPTGTITFKDGAKVIGIAQLFDGVATLTISTLSVGRHSIKAVYSGSASFLTSSSDLLIQMIGPAI